MKVAVAVVEPKSSLFLFKKPPKWMASRVFSTLSQGSLRNCCADKWSSEKAAVHAAIQEHEKFDLYYSKLTVMCQTI